MKKSILLSLAVLVLFSFCAKKKDSQSIQEQKPLAVKVADVQRGTLSKFLEYKGTVSAWRTANILPESSGRIGRIYKKQGDRVRKGDLLAELDLTTLQLQNKQARAAVAVAEAAYKDAQMNFERMKKLYDSKAISQMQLEKTQLGLEAADTQMKSAKANLDLVDYMLKNSSMRAPFDGIIAAKMLEEGDMINPMMGMSPGILILMDLSQVKVAVDVPSEEIEKIAIGQRCRVKVSSLEKEEFEGEVYSKNLAADPVSKTFKVEIRINNPKLKIKAGVFADIALEYLRHENVLLLPLTALLRGDRDVMVFNNGVADKRRVLVGPKNGTNFEVLSGVAPGEKVLIEGNYDLKDGSPVTISGE